MCEVEACKKVNGYDGSQYYEFADAPGSTHFANCRKPSQRIDYITMSYLKLSQINKGNTLPVRSYHDQCTNNLDGT